MINAIINKLRSRHVNIKETLCIRFNNHQDVAYIYDMDCETFSNRPIGTYNIGQDELIFFPTVFPT